MLQRLLPTATLNQRWPRPGSERQDSVFESSTGFRPDCITYLMENSVDGQALADFPRENGALSTAYFH